MKVSMEADLFPFDLPERADVIDGSIGELSPFHQTFGYYAHGEGETTAVLLAGWKERLVPIENVNTGGARGLCLEVHDLLVSKVIAGREKDVEFLRDAARYGLASLEVLRDRLALVSAAGLEPQSSHNAGRVSRATPDCHGG